LASIGSTGGFTVSTARYSYLSQRFSSSEVHSVKQAIWYFDFVSPFAYLHAAQLATLSCRIQPRPVLFAALLDHWGQKGPAEIESKRAYTYRYLQWVAAKRGIPFRMPATHPFNPLPFLRLAVAVKADLAVINTIFEALYTTAEDPSDPALWASLCSRLGVEDGNAVASQPWVKGALRDNFDAAIAAGVFGVPTVVVDGLVFWGEDSLPMLRDYLANPELMRTAEMERVAGIRASATRKT
jgi:2-hydroxychromene-2-carboxylate isomerase